LDYGYGIYCRTKQKCVKVAVFTNNITLASSPLYNASDVSGVGNTGVYSVPFSFRIKVIGL